MQVLSSRDSLSYWAELFKNHPGIKDSKVTEDLKSIELSLFPEDPRLDESFSLYSALLGEEAESREVWNLHNLVLAEGWDDEPQSKMCHHFGFIIIHDQDGNKDFDGLPFHGVPSKIFITI